VEARLAAGEKPGDLTDVDCSDNLDLVSRVRGSLWKW
jgi:hypothetical protein